VSDIFTTAQPILDIHAARCAIERKTRWTGSGSANDATPEEVEAYHAARERALSVFGLSEPDIYHVSRA
jgi:hypothetical protein